MIIEHSGGGSVRSARGCVVLQSDRVVTVSPSGANGKWVGRDGFVAEAAVQFDRINGTIARLERELEKSRATVAEMAEEANRNRRFQSFEEPSRTRATTRSTELQRCCKDIKTRLDTIEGEQDHFRSGCPTNLSRPIDTQARRARRAADASRAGRERARRNEVLFLRRLWPSPLSSLASRYHL